MDIYIYSVGPDVDDHKADLAESITLWLEENQINATLLNQASENQEHMTADNPEAWLIGLHLKAKKTKALKTPVNFLQSLTKAHQCDFAIAIYDVKTGATQDVCYFGHEEGKPDIFEIANYLGL